MNIRIEREQRDLFGVYWDRERLSFAEPTERGGRRGFLHRFSVHITIVPTLPLVISWDREEKA